MSSFRRVPSQNGLQSRESSRMMRNGVKSAKDVDTEFIPLIYKALRNVMEKAPGDQKQNVQQCHEIAHTLEQLQKKLDVARDQVKKLPGINSSKEEQEKDLKNLQAQLKKKKELISMYGTVLDPQQYSV